MDRQEQHHQKKEKEREQKNKQEKAYEEPAEASRPPIRSVGLFVLGFALTALIVVIWTFYLW